MKPAYTHRAAIVRAAEMVGGAGALAHRLQVPMSELSRWLAGVAKPSMGIFLKVIDILIEEGQKPQRPRAGDEQKPVTKRARE